MQKIQIELSSGTQLRTVQADSGDWGIEVVSPTFSSVRQMQPAQVEVYQGEEENTRFASGYRSICSTTKGFVGYAQLSGPDGTVFSVEDSWSVSGQHLLLERSVRVTGSARGGFLSAFRFLTDSRFTWPDLDYFAPGRIYGTREHLLPVAPGGALNYNAGRFEAREDWLPLPVFGLYFRDGSSVAVMDPAPRGDTVAADGVVRGDKVQPDGRLIEGEAVIDGRLAFGALGGADLPDGGVEFGFWFPGTMSRGMVGEQGPYRAWWRRYHPVQDGFRQDYSVEFRFGREETFHDFYRNTWRWAWRRLKPKVNWHDIAQARKSLIAQIAGCAETCDGRTGLHFWEHADRASAENPPEDGPWQAGQYDAAILGFVGKNLEAASYLIRDAEDDGTERGKRHRMLGLQIIDSFLKMDVAPPSGEGFHIRTGAPAFTNFGSGRCYLRSFTEDMKNLLRLYEWEKERGRDHPDWVKWCRSFADWLLPQRTSHGGFPRSWFGATGEVADPAPESSYNVVPFFVLLSRIAGDDTYLRAAVQAADYCWVTDQARDQFVGGTIDNPNIIDKEAATLSMEGYLDLFRATGERRWLDRAVAAAEFAETWMLAWDLPMPEDLPNERLHWKKGVPTTGVNLINSTGNGYDQWMAYDAGRFAELYQLTGDPHCLEVAAILLHNTKSMIGLPERLYDLRGPGWQQEHWGMGPGRGIGHHRWWLPWVSTCHLGGIYALAALDKDLFDRLCTRPGEMSDG